MIRRILPLLFLFLIIFSPKSNIAAGPTGWASVSAYGQNGTTGGSGGIVVTVNSMADLITHAQVAEPRIIQIEGLISITPKGRYINVTSNKTIVGITADAGISQGGFRVGSGQRNIIFRNLTVADTFVPGDWAGDTQDWDGIQLKGTCHHIWIDHCTFLRQGDGAVDISNGASYITISNSRFGENNKAMLIGSSDTDIHTDKYKVTMHHNWFDETTQRHPRVRFGQVHLFNNYYFNMGGYGRRMGFSSSMGYGIGVGIAAQIYSEHNYFELVSNPVNFIDANGSIIDIGSHLVESGAMITSPAGINWNPANHYQYTLDDADKVKAIVMATAGAGRIITSIHNPFEQQGIFFLKCYPNPVQHIAHIVFEIPSPGMVVITVRDITGRMVREVARAHFGSGRHAIEFNRNDLGAGIYLITLESNNRSVTQKIVLN